MPNPTTPSPLPITPSTLPATPMTFPNLAVALVPLERVPLVSFSFCSALLIAGVTFEYDFAKSSFSFASSFGAK